MIKKNKNWYELVLNGLLTPSPATNETSPKAGELILEGNKATRAQPLFV